MDSPEVAMRTDPIGARPPLGTPAARGAAGAGPANRPAPDAVALSEAAREHERLRRLAAEYEAQRAERVAAIGLGLLGAGPVPDSAQIARAMLALAD